VKLIIKVWWEKGINEKKTDTLVNNLNKRNFSPLKAEINSGLKDMPVK